MRIHIKVHLTGWLVSLLALPLSFFGQAGDSAVLQVNKTTDFQLTGTGDEANWSGASWVPLPLRKSGGVNYKTQMKVLYSDSGLYCLYSCEDSQLTSTLREDFADLYNEDVVEAFFWPDENSSIYFEYELSPFNYELPILVPNFHGTFLGWRPWHYEGNRLTRHATHVNTTSPNRSPVSWTAEFYIPFQLLRPLQNVPPARQTKWRANFYRIDYDRKVAAWSWQLTRKNFHDYEKFGTLIFN